jgi:hypothetical protein
VTSATTGTVSTVDNRAANPVEELANGLPTFETVIRLVMILATVALFVGTGFALGGTMTDPVLGTTSRSFNGGAAVLVAIPGVVAMAWSWLVFRFVRAWLHVHRPARADS